MKPTTRTDNPDSIYNLSFKDSLGQEHQLDQFKGKALLIVNTATGCGLAPQFVALEKLWKTYGPDRLVVIGFPSNQFAQEAESDESMVGVCQKNFGVTFLLSEVTHVNGAHAHPVFTYLKAHSKAFGIKAIKWNFTKFLVHADGTTIERFGPTVLPESMEDAVKRAIRSSSIF